MEKEQTQSVGSFTVNVYAPGNQIVKEQTNNYYGPVYQGGARPGEYPQGFSDDQVKKALLACVGEGKVINAKWKWAGAYWYLRWACMYPVDPQEFFNKIKGLELDIEEKYQCSYRSIREYTTLSFMNQDARRPDKAIVSPNDMSTFVVCREIAVKLAEELGKAYLPKV